MEAYMCASALLLSLATLGTASAATFDAREMMKLKRLADPQVSPDGRWVAYTVTEVEMPSGARNAEVWVSPVAGGEPRRLTNDPKSDTRPRWSPDGKMLGFLSTREGGSQVYALPAAGGDARKLTSLATGADGFLWIDAKTLLVVSDVYPECNADDACNKKKIEAAGKPSPALLYDKLLYRHWDTWEDGRRTHLLVVPTDGREVRDLTPGDGELPFNLGGPDDYALSPDGKEACFSRKDDPQPALSTNAELYVVPVAGGAPRRIAGSPGYDGACHYSPDGSAIAWRAQMRAGYESDRWRLFVSDRRAGVPRNLTEPFDQHVEGFAWSSDAKTLYFTAGDAARSPIFSVAAAGGPPRKVLDGGTFGDLQVVAGGRALVLTKMALTHPTEIYRVDADGRGLAPITKANDAFLSGFNLKTGESVTYTGAAGKNVQAWIVKPASFDPAKKYPVLVLIHGGPQGVWEDGWTYRWNAQVFANAGGFVVFAPNPRGSTGWGQEFVDDVNGDWGGRAYEDILKGTDFVEALPYVAQGRTVAAGASYGGYMVNWIAGHTDRYKALVSHDGLFDLRSMYGSTEELWFVEWEFKGPFWENPEMYERWTPSAHVKSFKTPTLVVHGELDYRVPLEQGLSMFTALQRRGVPSKLLVFPDENHWVLKPLNSLRWYDEVLGWLKEWSAR
jgi:dipeptidyl aminopeptidase/acylaminoacyl peptidase